MLALSNLDDGRAVLQPTAQIGEYHGKCFEQDGLAHIAKSHPDDLGWGSVTSGKMLEIFVHADDAKFPGFGECPDFRVGNCAKTELPHMNRLEPVFREETGESFRQLVVDQEFQAARRTR